MALPYFVLAWFPQWRRALPRPGPWMARLKQLLAFPLYATVAWLVWVLAAQVGNDAVIRIGVVLVLIAFALWAWRTWRAASHRAWGGVAVVGAVAGLLVAWPLFAGVRNGADMPQAQTTNGWQPYSPERVAELTAQGRPVFVDFTAAWCITCQVNERLVLNDASVRDAFARAGVALVRADWTRRDAAISEALAALGRSGVPAYVIYRKDREPQLLPEVLQRQTVIAALAS
jgi:thiol:disulfide interchange protein DsbD